MEERAWQARALTSREARLASHNVRGAINYGLTIVSYMAHSGIIERLYK
jgi:hypothetical protein